MKSLTESILGSNGAGIKVIKEKLTSLITNLFDERNLYSDYFVINERQSEITIGTDMYITGDYLLYSSFFGSRGYKINLDKFIDLLRYCDNMQYTIKFNELTLGNTADFFENKELSRLFFKIARFDCLYFSLFYCANITSTTKWKTEQFLDICENKKIQINVKSDELELDANKDVIKGFDCSAKQSIQNVLSIKTDLTRINFHWEDHKLTQRYMRNSIARISNWIGDITNVGCKELAIRKSEKVTDYERRSKKMIQTEEEQIKLFKQNNKNCKLTIQNY
jgi:hypothetical protein